MEKNTHIHSVLSKIEDVWNRVPGWRFMQLLDNFLEENAADCFYMEDDKFIDELEKYINRILPPVDELMKEVLIERHSVTHDYGIIKVPESYTNSQIRHLINTNLYSLDFKPVPLHLILLTTLGILLKSMVM
jgi:hypothetical protein